MVNMCDTYCDVKKQQHEKYIVTTVQLFFIFRYTYGKPVKGTVNVTFSFLPFLPPTSDYIEVKKYSGIVREVVKVSLLKNFRNNCLNSL